LIEQRTQKRSEYEALESSVFQMNEDATICPTCKRVHDDDKLYNIEEEMRGNFNADKAKKLKAMIEDAPILNEQIAKVKAEILKNDNLLLESKSDYREVCNWLTANKKPVFAFISMFFCK